jgi:aldehyde dehydrogenase (NAD+)
MDTLTFDPNGVASPAAHYIGGRLTHRTAALDVLRPSDARPAGALPDASVDDVDEAVQNAQAAWTDSGWGHWAPRDRAKALRRWADLLDSKAAEFACIEAVCSTRPVRDAYAFDVPFTAECIRFFAECADKFGGDAVPTKAGSLGLIVPEPFGVVAAIAPWNFPLSMASWKCGPALAAGNAIVLKPSELTPYSAVHLAALAVEAGVPPGVFNVIQGRGETAGAALVRHPLVRKVSFTGSTRTGAAIMCDAAQHGTKPVTLELGGKSPQVVFDDAGDLAALADRIVRGFTSNAGQACVSGTRLIVQRGISAELLDTVMARLGQMDAGPTWSDATRYPPLINAAHAAKVHAAVQASLNEGAQVLCGGHPFIIDGGSFYPPTLLGGVSADCTAVREEIFGPVLTVQTFQDEEEAWSLADHATYGLAAGIHTADLGRALRGMRRIAAGTIWVNRFGRTADFIIPTGGFKGSGIGKDLGRQAFEANLRFKSVLIDF